GAAAHTVRLRGMAEARGARINEHGVFRVDSDTEIVPGEREEEIYHFLGLPWIPPELREDRGEIEAALAGRLPDLIDVADFRGILHAHTTWSDGSASIRQMAAAARDLGHAYLAITDHSKSLGVARGLDEVRLRAQMAEVDALHAEAPGVLVLKGIECDILADGTLDLDTGLLAQLDFVIGSIHSGFRQDEETMTRRIVAAMESGVVDLLAHPTGRLLGAREPYAVDLERVIEAALRTGTALEINAYPDRLDLDDVHARRAAERGIPISINPDAHMPVHLSLLRYGVGQARRAWLTADQVINTWPPERLLGWLRGRRERRRGHR
ncbi:MAG: PHP domain-containing protein, partial [Armatimonadetes bacterium]|nr:PHP domain-containing protein [Armatimonadota bacterium]